MKERNEMSKFPGGKIMKIAAPIFVGIVCISQGNAMAQESESNRSKETRTNVSPKRHASKKKTHSTRRMKHELKFSGTRINHWSKDGSSD
jgi:hypothetical protein